MISTSTASARAQNARGTPGTAERPILCLHCSTGSSRQWQSLETRLGPERRIIAPDLLGYGANPPWHGKWRPRLGDEVHALRPLLASADGPVDVVAHSFGAAVALKLATDSPASVRSLCLYEPVLFGLLREHPSATRALTEVFMTVGGIESALALGDRAAAARRFVDFWSGNGTWRAMPEPRRACLAERIVKVPADFEAVFADDVPAARLRRLNVPVLCVAGDRSPQAVRRISSILVETLPRARHERLADAGHMGPLTHARAVNERIADFLGDVAAGRADSVPTPFTARAA